MLVQRVVSPFLSTLSEPGLPTRSVMPVWFICIWLPSLLVVDGLVGASRSTCQVVAAAVVAVVSSGETRRLLKVPLPAPTRRSSSPKLSLRTGSLKVRGVVAFVERDTENNGRSGVNVDVAAVCVIGLAGNTVADAVEGTLQVPGGQEC